MYRCAVENNMVENNMNAILFPASRRELTTRCTYHIRSILSKYTYDMTMDRLVGCDRKYVNFRREMEDRFADNTPQQCLHTPALEPKPYAHLTVPSSNTEHECLPPLLTASAPLPRQHAATAKNAAAEERETLPPCRLPAAGVRARRLREVLHCAAAATLCSPPAVRVKPESTIA